MIIEWQFTVFDYNHDDSCILTKSTDQTSRVWQNCFPPREQNSRIWFGNMWSSIWLIYRKLRSFASKYLTLTCGEVQIFGFDSAKSNYIEKGDKGKLNSINALFLPIRSQLSDLMTHIIKYYITRLFKLTRAIRQWWFSRPRQSQLSFNARTYHRVQKVQR
jgi:hypothetical protein